ncbi:MAG: methionine biosynthesis protein MetW [Pseudomonadales bacterium]|uniref:Methionine biosynthesis protein MetW n=1 Tax=Oleiphilus messinensis TaxID=141451 RepID=A0A1Y0I6K4_9GAMM|nr:methionine biosynthesis protein MetW [Oleiphilus messinensis]ARU55033.1 methionine biosynthesis protein MetW [Oleiphilus messinensis]MCG8610859.1 methionine biosynthesis protein MetW [Pseudomonadales bacterium]
MRPDLDIIQEWIAPSTHILDVGCGDGTLLRYLQEHKSVSGYGLEINPSLISHCIRNGVNVIEQDVDSKGLSNFQDDSFDAVVMTQALQAVRQPDIMLEEMLRLGRECIITFPNFGHWTCRYYLAGKGKMPMSKTLPYTWYNTPNIHLCTFKDFETLCYKKNIRILNRTVVDREHRHRWFNKMWPNLLGEIAIYRVTRSLR